MADGSVSGGRNPHCTVTCSECAKTLSRRLLHPATYRPLSAFYCDFGCKAAAQRRARPVSADWLRQKYVVERMDCVAIGVLVGRDPKRVWEWLKDSGIPTRARGDDTGAHRFQKGQVSPFKGRTQLRGAASPHWQGGITPERQAFAATPEWRAACMATFARAQKRCERCAATQAQVQAAGQKMHVHHVVGFRVVELRADPDNLRLLCGPCHRFVHSKKNVARIFLSQEIAA